MSGDIERYYEELNFFLLDFHLPEDRTLLLHLPELVVISLSTSIVASVNIIATLDLMRF